MPARADARIADPLVLQAANRESQYPGRRRIDPVEVIDREDERRHHRERSERAEGRHRYRVLIRRRSGGFRPHERDLEGSTLGGRHADGHRLEHVLEEIPERGVGERGLRLDRARGEHDDASVSRVVDGLGPQRRLPDPGLTLQEQPARTIGYGRDEDRDLRELLVSAEETDPQLRHPPPSAVGMPDGTRLRLMHARAVVGWGRHVGRYDARAPSRCCSRSWAASSIAL